MILLSTVALRSLLRKWGDEMLLNPIYYKTDESLQGKARIVFSLYRALRPHVVADVTVDDIDNVQNIAEKMFIEQRRKYSYNAVMNCVVYLPA